ALPQVARPREVRPEQRQPDEDERKARPRKDEQRGSDGAQDDPDRDRERLARMCGQPLHWKDVRLPSWFRKRNRVSASVASDRRMARCIAYSAGEATPIPVLAAPGERRKEMIAGDGGQGKR